MALGIAGIGIVTPLGDDARQHAFHLRAKLRPAIASAMRTADDEPLDVLHVPTIGAHAPLGERLAALARAAADEALAGVALAGPPALALAGPARRAGVDAAALEPVASTLRGPGGAPVRGRFFGDGGGLLALAAAERWLDAGEPAVLVVAVDSFVWPPSLEARVLCPPGPWSRVQPPPAEGAAAMLLVRRGDPAAAEARLGQVLAVADRAGAGADDDDEPPDGTALTDAVRALPGSTIEQVWGQHDVDDLREGEWRLAAARIARRLQADVVAESLERFAGRLGGAAGLAGLVVGLASLRHRTAPPGASTILAWAIDPDGRRVAAIAEGATA